MVLIAACVLAITAIRFYAFGIFLVPLTTEFDWDRGALSAAPSMSWLIAGFLSILTGRLSDRYGPQILVTTSGLLTGIALLLMSQVSSLWQVYLIWGLLMGIGGACCYIPIISTIPRWFAQRRGTAIGITYTGFGLGAIISPPLTQWLISYYGWQQAFIVLGLITFIIFIPLAQFMKHSPQRMGLLPYGESETIEDKQAPALAAGEFSLKEAIKTGRFWLFSSILLCFFFCMQVITVHIAPYAIDIRIPAIVAASTLSIIGGSSIIGRLSIGPISDRIGSRKVLSACLTLATLALIWLLFAKGIWGFYIFAVLFGLAYGGVVPLETLITGELFGVGSLGIILASLELFPALGSASGAPLAGSIFDVTGSYRLAFLICVVLCMLAIILSLILLRSKVEEAQYPMSQ